MTFSLVLVILVCVSQLGRWRLYKNFKKLSQSFVTTWKSDYIIPEVPNSSDASKHTRILDNHMFLAHGGRERTEIEFENLCKSYGFSKFHNACSSISYIGVMEFYK